MKRSVLKLGILALLAVAMAGVPTPLRSQDAGMSAPEKQSPQAPKRNNAAPFHGKLKAVDKSANTISVGSMVIHITSDTKLLKDGKTATLDDAITGEEVAGSYRKSEDGKLNASMVRFGPKPETAAKDAKN